MIKSNTAKTKKIILCVTNDLVADQRVNKVAESLKKAGYQVSLVGRKLPGSPKLKTQFKAQRMKLLFNKSALFYANYNIRLFFYLLFSKVNAIVANDLDTLPAAFLATRLKNCRLIYDSHEYFTEMPELINRPLPRKVWLNTEKFLLPRIKYSYTVCQSIADIYNQKYQLNMAVIRNVPKCKLQNPKSNKKPNIFPLGKKIILYQGAVNRGRGIDYVIKAMKYINNAVFVIIGDGDKTNELKQLAKDQKVTDKVIFTGRIPFQALSNYTKYADVGISLEENMGLNYYYALPNKLFDYIRVNVPVLASPLPEIKRIVDNYQIGCMIEKHEEKHIAGLLKEMLENESLRQEWQKNITQAQNELCWEKEEVKLLEVYERALGI